MDRTKPTTKSANVMTYNKTLKYSRGYFTVVTLLLALSLAACDSVTDLTPQSELTEANYFRTAEDIDNAVVGIYAHYASKLPADWYLMEFPTDHLHISEYRSVAGLNSLGNLDFDPANSRFSSFWQNAYNGIFRANSVLDNIDNPEDYRGGQRAQLEAEAKFMRALYYFDLVRGFGGVPLVTTRLTVEESQNTGRASESEIYSQIITDLEDAIDGLPAPDNISAGRANVAAAHALLGKVHVYLEDWSNALTHLERVDDYGYELEEDFATLFSLEGASNNNEFIFQMNYIENVVGHSLCAAFVPYQGAEGINDAGREDALISWSLHKKFEEEDSRKDVTVTEYWKNPASDEDEEWYPYASKFAIPYPDRSSCGLTLPVLRYADVVLLRAEALYHSGSETEALAELNRVRERAFGDDSHNYADASNFMDKLMEERQLELAFENERWFDLVRTGRFMDELAVHERIYNPSTGEGTTVNYDVQPYKARWPIPQHEIDQALPGVLEQNEGY